MIFWEEILLIFENFPKGPRLNLLIEKTFQMFASIMLDLDDDKKVLLLFSPHSLHTFSSK